MTVIQKQTYGSVKQNSSLKTNLRVYGFLIYNKSGIKISWEKADNSSVLTLRGMGGENLSQFKESNVKSKYLNLLEENIENFTTSALRRPSQQGIKLWKDNPCFYLKDLV